MGNKISSDKSILSREQFLRSIGWKERELKTLLLGFANASNADFIRSEWEPRWWKSEVFFEEYSNEQLINFRDELRMLWKSPRSTAEVPADGAPAYAAWQNLKRDIPQMTLHEFVLNDWLEKDIHLNRPQWHVFWDKKGCVLSPAPLSLPSALVHAVMVFNRRLLYCRNKKCKAPYFIASKSDGLYCSPECAAPAKRAAKRKWWRHNRGADADR